MAEAYTSTNAFRGARFTDADLSGSTFRSCDLQRIKIVDSWLMNVSVSGDIQNFLVNDVDVTAFVDTELDRRHPERLQLRAMRTAEEHRAMWDTVERLWAGAVDRAVRLPEPARDLQVDDEWSFVQTQRHLVFATDAWVSRTILDDPMPYHRIGLPDTSFPPADAAAVGVDLAASPSFAEVMAVRAARLALVRDVVDGLSDADLDRPCTRSPGPGHPDEARTVGSCLGVVMEEETSHYRYAVRDLAVLEAG